MFSRLKRSIEKYNIAILIGGFIVLASTGLFYNFGLGTTVNDETPGLAAALKMIGGGTLRPDFPTLYYPALFAFAALPGAIAGLLWLFVGGYVSSLSGLNAFVIVDFAKLLPWIRLSSVLYAALTLYFLYRTALLIFTEKMLRPELQDWDTFVDGVDNIVSTHRRVAESYFRDGSIDAACPPLRALLHIMRDGTWNGKDLRDPSFRNLFTRQSLLKSRWYNQRLRTYQKQEIILQQRHATSLKRALEHLSPSEEIYRKEFKRKLMRTKSLMRDISKPSYLKTLQGTIGIQPLGSHLINRTGRSR